MAQHRESVAGIDRPLAFCDCEPFTVAEEAAETGDLLRRWSALLQMQSQ